MQRIGARLASLFSPLSRPEAMPVLVETDFVRDVLGEVGSQPLVVSQDRAEQIALGAYLDRVMRRHAAREEAQARSLRRRIALLVTRRREFPANDLRLLNALLAEALRPRVEQGAPPAAAVGAAADRLAA
ncbi:MAG: hypothetical protein HY056_05995 [Proteobacteria bacterium]|nr:hypothetical protein [Pseudomonadota bacterium]